MATQSMAPHRPSVCVIGAGIIGTASAFALDRAGWNVTLCDAFNAPGQGTSFANGAQLSYSYVEPLASPATLRSLPSLLLSPHSPFFWKPRLSLSHWKWITQFALACSQSRTDRGTRDLLHLAGLGRNTLHSWLECLGTASSELHYQRPGKLVIYRDALSRPAAQRQIDLQAGYGCEQRLLTAQECLGIEPALGNDQGNETIAFGVWTPSEEVIDPAALCRALSQASGATLQLGQPIRALQVHKGKVVALDHQGESIHADHFVLAAGLASADLTRPLGLHLPLEAIKGYSITLAVQNAAAAPQVSVTDVARKIVYARLGNKVRVAGFAELGNRSLGLVPDRIQSLCRSAQSMFPEAFETSAPHAWAGLRPATPDSLPIIGATRWPNLWLNTGHGALGLTLAAGSAAVLKDLMLGLKPGIDPYPFHPPDFHARGLHPET